AEFIEVESGKKDDRPELRKAIEAAKNNKAKLIIAKLDRLSRNVRFIAELLESKIEFVCCDMPDANNFTIHIFAALAQQERELISARTKAALRAKKERGEKLGNPRNFTEEERAKAINAIKARSCNNENNLQARAFAQQLHDAGYTPAQILAELQSKKFKTARGKAFSQIVQVLRLLKK
ncbi:MAG: recombinase family protein, partial [Cytophagales bacterium]|nr:recombinase family protein [Cytophagales bacterium]